MDVNIPLEMQTEKYIHLSTNVDRPDHQRIDETRVKTMNIDDCVSGDNEGAQKKKVSPSHVNQNKGVGG